MGLSGMCVWLCSMSENLEETATMNGWSSDGVRTWLVVFLQHSEEGCFELLSSHDVCITPCEIA